MHIGDLWNGKGPLAHLGRTAMLPLSGLYALGWEGYLAIYRFGFKRARAPHHPVVCIGNLVTGGSGKSPLTIHVAGVLAALGYRVVISASGYGAPHAEAAAVAPEGPLSASEWGDEPSMFRWLMPEVPLIVGRRRVLAAELASQHFPDHVLLMDDGFQHLPLKKDITLILDETNPRNRWCLPAGPYREGRWNRSRADLVLPGQFEVKARPLQFESPDGQIVAQPRMYAALAALGQPDRFFAALAAAGASPSPAIALSDHDPLTGGNLLTSLPKDRPTVVTAKDWVKLKDREDVGTREFLIARHQVTVEPAEEFRAWWKHKLDEHKASGTPE